MLKVVVVSFRQAYEKMTTGVHMLENICFQMLISLALTLILVKAQYPYIPPEFMAPVENLTATQGQYIQFTCIVNYINRYKVAWIKLESKQILAIHTRSLTMNQRITASHDGNNTWKLHIANVQLNDTGSYVCQVNTDPMRGQNGYLNVVEPPSEEVSSASNIVNTLDIANFILLCLVLLNNRCF